jgi:hypothetical protein
MAASHEAKACAAMGATAASAKTLKRAINRDLLPNYIFKACAVETMGPWCPEPEELLANIAGCLRQGCAGEDNRASQHVHQRISMAVQRGNAVSLLQAATRSAGLPIWGV